MSFCSLIFFLSCLLLLPLVMIRCRSGGGGTRQGRGIAVVAESLVGCSSALSGECAPDLARTEGSSIVDKPREC